MKASNLQPSPSYVKSNAAETVRLERFRRTEYSALLRDRGDRQRLAQSLVDYLADRFGVPAPSVCVLESNQPHRTGVSAFSGRSRVKWQKMGDYTPSMRRICIYNRTAVKGGTVSIKGFADTLLHEFMHHYDYTVLHLADSLHTTGFYKRISDLKAKLAP